jgi:predicted amidohydrolase
MNFSSFDWTLQSNFEINKPMKTFLVQPDTVWEDRPANFGKVKSLLEKQSIPSGSLIILPEMFATGFSMNLGVTIEAASSETESFLSELAQSHQSTVIAGIVRQGKAGKGRNEIVVMEPSGKALARYCKLHPFSFGGEDQHYEKGENVVSNCTAARRPTGLS